MPVFSRSLWFEQNWFELEKHMRKETDSQTANQAFRKFGRTAQNKLLVLLSDRSAMKPLVSMQKLVN